MCIKMTIEVTPEQAVKIAELLSDGCAENAVLPTPVTAPIVAPLNVQQPPVQQPPVMPVQTVAASTAAPITTPATAPVQAAPLTAVKQYTQDELSLASRPIVEAGRQQELLDLLHSFTFTDTSGVTRNVQSIRDLPAELYPAFANGIRQLGGRI